MAGRRRSAVVPTITDVARECGVAASTVSRALSRPGRVSEPTRERILQVADRMGYRPNPIARALPSGRTAMLALLVPDVTNPFFSLMIRGAERQAAAAGYTLVLADTDESPEAEAIHIERLARTVDGIIIGTPRLPAERIGRLAGRYPLALVNGVVSGVAHVVIDTPGGMSQAGEHFASLGHRFVAYLAGPRASWADRSRWRALQSAGAFIHHLPVDQPFTLEAGTKIWGYPKIMADFTIREGRRFGFDISVDGQLVADMEFRRGLPFSLTPRQQEQRTYSHRDGVTRETAFEHTLDGVRTRFGGVRIRLGDHPYAKELASLGLPKRAMVSSSVENVQMTFGDAQEIS